MRWNTSDFSEYRDPLPDGCTGIKLSCHHKSSRPPRECQATQASKPLKAVSMDGSLVCQICEYRAPSAKALRVHLVQVHQRQEQQRHRPTSQDPSPRQAIL
ncbi:hypothetical protein AVEN_87199-1 [Araneus ventricosus]|uniref:C2H2-type domain-containing protein n=1 Tax=Araneus ventricosus TaxID=182803 RepID=A0A4Y2TH25_ARAVE|nr:hypothetical protein AVEN_87199-1 [Araneus ventricosus]